jgi:hypothetical protein
MGCGYCHLLYGKSLLVLYQNPIYLAAYYSTNGEMVKHKKWHISVYYI